MIEEGEVALNLRGLKCTLGYTLRWAHKADPTQVTNLLLLHGHSSSREEFDDLYPYIENANVFVFDQPNCGRSSTVDRDAVFNTYTALKSDPHSNYPGLFFLHDIALLFVAKVLAWLPAKSVRVAGGSLGGNLGLMLIEREPVLPWLRDAVIWSPGSAWAGDVYQAASALPALKWAGQDWSGDDARRSFLQNAWAEPVVKILGIPVTNPQPWYWYWDGWGGGPRDTRPDLATDVANHEHDMTLSGAHYPLMTERKATAIRDAFRKAYHAFAADQGEAVWNAKGANRAKWHWQIASDELAFSHRQMVDGKPRIARATRDVLLLAGEHDNHDPANLHEYTSQLHADLVRSGSSVWSDFRTIKESGHSIHNEQPACLAKMLIGPLHA